jgi:hypothetical protein
VQVILAQQNNAFQLELKTSHSPSEESKEKQKVPWWWWSLQAWAIVGSAMPLMIWYIASLRVTMINKNWCCDTIYFILVVLSLGVAFGLMHVAKFFICFRHASYFHCYKCSLNNNGDTWNFHHSVKACGIIIHLIISTGVF